MSNAYIKHFFSGSSATYGTTYNAWTQIEGDWVDIACYENWNDNYFLVKSDGTVWLMGDVSRVTTGSGINIAPVQFAPSVLNGIVRCWGTNVGESFWFLKYDGTLYAIGDNGQNPFLGVAAPYQINDTPVLVLTGLNINIYIEVLAVKNYGTWIKNGLNLYYAGYIYPSDMAGVFPPTEPNYTFVLVTGSCDFTLGSDAWFELAKLDANSDLRSSNVSGGVVATGITELQLMGIQAFSTVSKKADGRLYAKEVTPPYDYVPITDSLATYVGSFGVAGLNVYTYDTGGNILRNTYFYAGADAGNNTTTFPAGITKVAAGSAMAMVLDATVITPPRLDFWTNLHESYQE